MHLRARRVAHVIAVIAYDLAALSICAILTLARLVPCGSCVCGVVWVGGERGRVTEAEIDVRYANPCPVCKARAVDSSGMHGYAVHVCHAGHAWESRGDVITIRPQKQP